MQIIPFVPSAHQSGVTLLYKAIEDEYPEKMFGDPPLTLTELSRIKNRHYWVVLVNERVAGTIGIAILKDGNCALKGMFLSKELRGTDAAKRMLQAAIDGALGHQCKTMYLGTMQQFKAAQRFYEKQGFREVTMQELPVDFPANVVDTVFYQKAF